MLRGALAARLCQRGGLAGVPGARAGPDRPAAVRHRAAQDRHHRAAPAARRGPGAPGPGAVAGRGAAAPAAAADLGGQPGLPVHPGRLRAAPRRAPRVHGGALHGRRPGRGVLAAAAAVDALDLLGVPGPPAVLLRLAARPGLDRRVPAAPAQPAADRPGDRAPLGAEEPQPPVRAGRAAGGLPGRADRADPPRARASRSRRSAAWRRRRRRAGRTRSPARSSGGTSWSCGRPGSSGSAPSGPGTTRPGSSTCATRTWWRSGGHGGGGLRALRPAVHRRRGGRHAALAASAVRAGPSHRYTLADFGLTEEKVAERFGPAIIAG